MLQNKYPTTKIITTMIRNEWPIVSHCPHIRTCSRQAIPILGTIVLRTKAIFQDGRQVQSYSRPYLVVFKK